MAVLLGDAPVEPSKGEAFQAILFMVRQTHHERGVIGR